MYIKARMCYLSENENYEFKYIPLFIGLCKLLHLLFDSLQNLKSDENFNILVAYFLAIYNLILPFLVVIVNDYYLTLDGNFRSR